ncbi:MAG: hypothetical protein SGPRY_011161 [Prymnesium sp.]
MCANIPYYPPQVRGQLEASEQQLTRLRQSVEPRLAVLERMMHGPGAAVLRLSCPNAPRSPPHAPPSKVGDPTVQHEGRNNSAAPTYSTYDAAPYGKLSSPATYGKLSSSPVRNATPGVNGRALMSAKSSRPEPRR